MEEPHYFLIRRAESWAMESSLRSRLLGVAGVSDVHVRLGDGRIAVMGEAVNPEIIVSVARQQGCEVVREQPSAEGGTAIPWPDAEERAVFGPLGGAWLACLVGVMLAVAEHYRWLPALTQTAARDFWLAAGSGVLLLGLAVVHACFRGYSRYPGTAVLAAAAALALGALASWVYTVGGCLFLGAVCGNPYGYLDTALVAVGAASLVVTVGRNSWARLQRPLRERAPPCPSSIRVMRDGRIQSLALQQLRVGELVHAVTGETVAADGVVTRGYGTLDELGVTGRSEAQLKSEGDEVLAGSRVRDGDLVYCVNRTGRQTLLASLLIAARGSAAGGQGVAAAALARVLAVLIALAVAVGVFWWRLSTVPGEWVLQMALTALMFAAPVGFLWNGSRVLSGVMARLAQGGVLVRTREAVLTASRLRTVIFDQGLSLSQGVPQVMGVEPAAGVRVRDLFTLAASVEAESRHPLAEAIISAALERDLPILPATDLQSWPQEGMSGVVNGRRVLVGNLRLLRRFGVPTDLEVRCQEMADDGRVVVFVAVDGHHVGLLAVDDLPAPAARDTVRQLGSRGMAVVMVTGAARRSAEGFARSVGLMEVRADLSAGGKEDAVRSVAAEEGPAAVVVRAGVGDLMAAGDLGVVLRNPGEDIPEDGDVVLFNGLPGLLSLLDQARSAVNALRRVRSLCLAYSLLLVPLASGLSFPLFGWVLPAIAAPVVAAAAVIALDALSANGAMELSSADSE